MKKIGLFLVGVPAGIVLGTIFLVGTPFFMVVSDYHEEEEYCSICERMD